MHFMAQQSTVCHRCSSVLIIAQLINDRPSTCLQVKRSREDQARPGPSLPSCSAGAPDIPLFQWPPRGAHGEAAYNSSQGYAGLQVPQWTLEDVLMVSGNVTLLRLLSGGLFNLMLNIVKVRPASYQLALQQADMSAKDYIT